MQKNIRVGTVPTVDIDNLLNQKITIPPLDIQEEIVRVLDKLTDHTKEITKELTLRKKEYSYYRDYLLEFKNIDDDLEFHIDLLKTDEINLDYILKIIIDKVKKVDNVDKLKDEVRRLIRSSMESRPKESLILEFIDKIDILDKESLENIVENFYIYARDVKMMEIQGLINDEKLKDGAERFIQNSIEKGEVIEGGNELNSVLPALGRRGGVRLEKKKQVYEKIRDLVDIFIGI